jgi:2-isopropylmalate synthase
VAAAELALMAGGDRIEGTLFGNGERTGNVDIVTLALNMFTQGVDPQLNFSNINHIRSICERNTDIKVHPRHPYAGELVYTAFSGSHQDAINKGLAYRREHGSELWEVPYLPIDPTDVGRTYESIIRINSQSGKGGVAYILETEFGYSLPRAMHPEMGALVQQEADRTGREIAPEEILEIFQREYLQQEKPFVYESFRSYPDPDDPAGEGILAEVVFSLDGRRYELKGRGNGPIDACKNALKQSGFFDYRIENYHEHSLEQGSESRAIAYIQLRSDSGASYFGAGIDVNINRASVKAIFSALNRAVKGAGVMMV